MNIAILAQGGGGLLETARVTGETFGFNVWIFLSQIISFTIVALLLRKFAYKPILTVLEERRQKIAEGLLNAEKIKQQLADARSATARSWRTRTPRRRR
jgi:F-type H+-transporting ATPase subunit b